jgi:hypothetical protein
VAGNPPVRPVRTVRRHVIIGEPDQVAAALERVRDEDRLVEGRVEAYYANGRVKVIARIIDRPGPQPRRRRRLRTRVVVTMLAVASVLLAVAVWLTYMLVQALIAALPIILGILGILLLIWIGGQLGVCPGIHCPGCRHSR